MKRTLLLASALLVILMTSQVCAEFYVTTTFGDSKETVKIKGDSYTVIIKDDTSAMSGRQSNADAVRKYRNEYEAAVAKIIKMRTRKKASAGDVKLIVDEVVKVGANVNYSAVNELVSKLYGSYDCIDMCIASDVIAAAAALEKR